MGELAGRTGSANPALQGLRVRVRAHPCAPVSARPCVRVSGVLAGRAGWEQTPGCRLQVAGCRGPPSPCCSVPWASRVAPAPGSSRERPAAPLPDSPRGGRGRPSSGPRGHFSVAPSSRPPCVSSQLPPWASGK